MARRGGPVRGFTIGVAVTLALIVGGRAVWIGLKYLSRLIEGHFIYSSLVWLGVVLLLGGMVGAVSYVAYEEAPIDYPFDEDDPS